MQASVTIQLSMGFPLATGIHSNLVMLAWSAHATVLQPYLSSSLVGVLFCKFTLGFRAQAPHRQVTHQMRRNRPFLVRDHSNSISTRVDIL